MNSGAAGAAAAAAPACTAGCWAIVDWPVMQPERSLMVSARFDGNRAC